MQFNNNIKLNNNFENKIKKPTYKKTLPFFYTFLLVSLICMGYIYFNKANVKKDIVDVTGIYTDTYNIILKYGEQKNIPIKIEPENATNKNIKWTSSNPQLVNVDNFGNVTVLKNENGESTITATTNDNKYKIEIKINVIKIETIINVNNLKIINDNLIMKYGETTKIIAKIEPENATNKNIKWTSSNPKLISVDAEGNIKVLKNEDGESTITATTIEGGHRDTIVVKVNKTYEEKDPYIPPQNQNIKVRGLSLDKENITIKYNEGAQIKASISPNNATNKEIKWSSSNTTLVDVDNQGNIKAKPGKIGISTITATTVDGNFSKSVNVKVLPSGQSINFSGGNNYSSYKTNMLLQRNNAVMQSFAIHSDYIYISQQQGADAFGAHFSKIKLSEVNNITGTGQLFTNNVAVIKDTGHASNIDIEVTNNTPYLWTSCSKDTEEIKYHCRIPLNSIEFGNRITQEQKYNLKIPGSYLVSVDSDNRIITLMTGNRRNHTFTTYNLDDYIINKEKTNIINQFTIDNGNYDISRQGFEVSGNYIYSYEGNKNNNEKPGVYLSIYTLEGEKIVYRKPINYPDNDYYWEPEGIKIYNNKIYIGFGREDKNDSKKTSYIYILN